jgi:hypothetical protein
MPLHLSLGSCTLEAISSVKASLQSYLSNPDVAFGVYTPNLRLEVSCMADDGTMVSWNGNKVLCVLSMSRFACVHTDLPLLFYPPLHTHTHLIVHGSSGTLLRRKSTQDKGCTGTGPSSMHE